MGAICAGCLEPIHKSGTDSKFVLAGTEVFHSRCTALIATSVLTRYRLRINELKAKIAGGVIDGAEAARLRTRVNDLERELRQSEANADEWRQTRNRMHEAKDRAEQDKVRERSVREAAERALQVERADKTSMMRERDTARAELAEAKSELLRVRGVSMPKDGAETTADDAAVIRSKLLELE